MKYKKKYYWKTNFINLYKNFFKFKNFLKFDKELVMFKFCKKFGKQFLTQKKQKPEKKIYSNLLSGSLIFFDFDLAKLYLENFIFELKTFPSHTTKTLLKLSQKHNFSLSMGSISKIYNLVPIYI